MLRKYKVGYTWHSGETFGVMIDKEIIVELEDTEIENWKIKFEELDIDGSYKSINYMEVI